jgi:adenylyltransferase/sulfurtransferase
MMPVDPMDSRYAAHVALSAIGAHGQERIAAGRIALVGLGGLGCAVAQYLASSGLGHLTVCDFDRIESSNLARQVLYTPADVGRTKTEAAAGAITRINPDLALTLLPTRIDPDLARDLFRDHDLCIDASDNYGTRLAMNQAALATGTPWLMGSCVRMEGQLALFQAKAGTPCYRCAYGAAPDTLEDCPGAGIFAPVAGVVGTAMALQALKFLAGIPIDTALTLFDAERWSWRHVSLGKRSDCPACSGSAAA